MRTEKILIGEILMNNDRTDGGQGDIDSLARNMDKYGQINAVTVVEVISNPYRYRIIAGRRRVAAAESLGWAEIRADIYGADEIGEGSEEMIALSENAAREEMNAIDEGILYAKELKKGTPVEELAALFCRNKSTVYQRAKLAALVPEMRSLYKAGRMSLHVAAMASVLPEEAQKDIAENAGWVSEWDIKRAVKNVHDDFLSGLPAYCAECATCQKRTHYSDKSLFPELADSDDRCLDHECYCKKIGSRVEAAFSEWGERVKGTPELDAWDGKRIVTTVSVPDGITVLGIVLTELDEDTEADLFGDIGEFGLTEEGIAQLEGDGKTDFVPCWDGSEFHIAKLVKIADIDALFDDGEEKDTEEDSDWQKKRMEEIFSAIPETRRTEILMDEKVSYDALRKAEDIFYGKIKERLVGGTSATENAVHANIVLAAMNWLSKSELERYLPDAGVEEKDDRCVMYDKLAGLDDGRLSGALVAELIDRWRIRPSLSESDSPDFYALFPKLGIDLKALRDEAANEAAGDTDNANPEDTSETEDVIVPKAEPGETADDGSEECGGYSDDNIGICGDEGEEDVD